MMRHKNKTPGGSAVGRRILPAVFTSTETCVSTEVNLGGKELVNLSVLGLCFYVSDFGNERPGLGRNGNLAGQQIIIPEILAIQSLR